jgi:hypothetical protein
VKLRPVEAYLACFFAQTMSEKAVDFFFSGKRDEVYFRHRLHARDLILTYFGFCDESASFLPRSVVHQIPQLPALFL